MLREAGDSFSSPMCSMSDAVWCLIGDLIAAHVQPFPARTNEKQKQKNKLGSQHCMLL